LSNLTLLTAVAASYNPLLTSFNVSNSKSITYIDISVCPSIQTVCVFDTNYAKSNSYFKKDVTAKWIECTASDTNKVAFVYNSDSTSAASYKSILTPYGFKVDLVEQSLVPTFDFSTYGVIIADEYSSDAQEYTWIDDAHVNSIKNSNKPIVGICFGGGALFSKIGLWGNNGQGAGVSSDSIKVLLPNSPIFTYPLKVTLKSDSTAVPYSILNDYHPLYINGGYPINVSPLSLLQSNLGYAALTIEDSKYYYYGWSGTANNLTDAGKKIFVNMVYNAGNFSFNTLRTSAITALNSSTQQTSNTVNIFPNPSTGTFYIDGASGAQIYNGLGTLVSQTSTNTFSISQPGIYQVAVNAPNGNKFIKVVVE
jgi:hypothetical protein